MRIRPRMVSTFSPGAMTSTVCELRTRTRGSAPRGSRAEGPGASGPRTAPVSTGPGAV
jgi:hypothetical protein